MIYDGGETVHKCSSCDTMRAELAAEVERYKTALVWAEKERDNYFYDAKKLEALITCPDCAHFEAASRFQRERDAAVAEVAALKKRIEELERK